MATVQFYQASYVDIQQVVKNKAEKQKKRHKVVETAVDFDVFESEIKAIISENISEKNCILLEDNPEWRLMEILGLGKFVKGNKLENYSQEKLEDCDFIFGRLGRKKDISGVQLRDRETYLAQNIEKGQQDDVEIYTYFYIFFEKKNADRVVTIAYLSSQSAPGIRTLSNLVTRYGDKDHKRLNITPILTQDILQVLKKKDTINSFSYKVSVPADTILKNELNLSEEEFDKFRNLTSADLVITIGAGRNKDLFEDREILHALVEKIPINKKKQHKELSFRAKNDGELLDDYKYIDNKVVRRIDFDFQSSDTPEARQKEIKDKLFEAYKLNRSSLLSFVRG